MTPPERDTGEKSMASKISSMSAGEKTRLALTGDKTARTILLRQKNEQLRLLVLQNPRITENEVLQLANSTEASKDILERIVLNREWMRRYRILYAVALNPKTPLPKAVKLLDNLKERDLRFIAKSKNVQTAVAAGARRILYQRGKI